MHTRSAARVSDLKKANQSQEPQKHEADAGAGKPPEPVALPAIAALLRRLLERSSCRRVHHRPPRHGHMLAAGSRFSHSRRMIEAEAERTVRDLADRYQADPFSMPESDLERLAEAVQLLGHQRVFEIVQEYKRQQRGA